MDRTLYFSDLLILLQPLRWSKISYAMLRIFYAVFDLNGKCIMKTYLLLFLVSIWWIPLTAQPAFGITEVLDSIVLDLADREAGAGVAIAVVDSKTGNTNYATHGKLPGGQAIDEHTKFRIGSVTKTFTALAILLLADEGKIDIHSPAERYLPELAQIRKAPGSPDFTVHHLLTHTAGLREAYQSEMFIDELPGPSLDVLKNDTLLHEPGFIQAYSNFGYHLLGAIIERVSGKSYGEFLQIVIFDPLGMKDTGLYAELSADKALAPGTDGVDSLIVEPFITYQAAGDIVSTAVDMQRFLNAFLQPDTSSVVSWRIVKKMQQNQVNGVVIPSGERAGYGLYDIPTVEKYPTLSTTYGHSGDTYYYHSTFSYAPKLGLGVVVMTNYSEGGSTVRQLSDRIWADLSTGHIPADAEAAEALDIIHSGASASSEHWEGEYAAGGELIRVKRRSKRKLVLRTNSAKLVSTELTPGAYRPTFKLFGFIPIKLKQMRFLLKEYGGRHYIQQAFTSDSTLVTIGPKRIDYTRYPRWQQYDGRIQLINPSRSKMATIPTAMRVENDYIYLTLTNEYLDFEQTYILEPVSDRYAVSSMVGRGMGEFIYLLDNGNLFFSGYEFRVVDDSTP